MRSRWPASVCGWFVLVGFGLLLSRAPGQTGSADEPNSYVPLGAPAALHWALQAQVKAVRDWLAEKDYGSAAQTTRGLTTLAHLYGQRFADPAWKKRCDGLVEASNRLAAAAGKKSAPECQTAVEECGKLLDELGKNQPKEAGKTAVKGYKPQGTLKTWMTLLDGAYVDAKSSANAQELEQRSEVIAAQANALAYLRGDAAWRKYSLAVRDTALQVAEQAKANQFDDAKKSLKGIFQRCEACHDGLRK